MRTSRRKHVGGAGFQPAGGNAALAAIVAEGLFSRLSFGLISFALPLYARHLGLSLAEVGLLASLNSIVALASKPMLGWVADRFGLKRTFVASIGIRSLVSLLFGFAAAPWSLFAIRSMHGLSMSLRDPSANVLLADCGGKKSVASAFAWYQTAKTVAGSISKAIAGILLTITAANYPLVFFIAFALSVLPLIVVVFFVKEQSAAVVEEPSASVPAEKETASAGARRPSMLPFLGLGFLISGSAEMLSGLFPVLATEYAGLSKAQAGIIYSVSTLVTIFSGPIFGWLSDHVSQKLVLLVRSVANTASSALYLLAPSFAGIGIARTVDDMGKAAFRPAWGALMAQVASYDRRTRARTMSWMSMGEDAGGAFAPFLAGFLWSAWGVGVLMAVRIVLAIVTEVYAYWATDRCPQHDSGAGCHPARRLVTAAPAAVAQRQEADSQSAAA